MQIAANRPIRKQRCAVVLLTLGMVVAGCGGPANKYDSEVTGTITIDGDLAPSGTITFHPVSKTGKIAIGRIYPDGSFSLRTGQGDLRESDGGTVEPGEYIVTVIVTGPAPPSATEGGPPGAGPLLIDSRYASRDTSDLRCTIEEGDNVVQFDLEPPAAVVEDAVEPTEEGAAAGPAAGTVSGAGEDAKPASDPTAPAGETGSATDVVETETAPAEGAAP